jgi:diguanylate cyclase (GGDEF)-like protein
MSDAGALVERAKLELIPVARFSGELAQLFEQPGSPFSHVHAVLEPSGNLPASELGAPGDGDLQHRESLSLANSPGSFRVDFWATDQPVDKRAVATICSAVTAFWAGDRRTSEMTGLISAGSPGTRAAAAETVQGMLSSVGGAAVMFADLDHLGDLNAKHGENVVDGVLGELAGILATAAPPDVLVLHRSGDEFLLMCPGTPDRSLYVAWQIQKAISEHEFPIEDDVAMSIGIFTVRPWDSWRTFVDLEKRAERALKPDPEDGSAPDKVRRGRASLSPGIEAGGDLGLTEDGARKLALALVKSCVDNDCPFDDPWLNFLSQATFRIVSGEPPEEWGQLLSAAIQWMSPTQVDGPQGAAGLRLESAPGPTLSAEDAGFALGHGVLRAILDQRLDADIVDDLRVNITPSGGVLSLSETLGEILIDGLMGDERQLELGGPIMRGNLSPVESRRALLVKIGHKSIGSLSRVFADIITVDDRPTYGGALPDFWEASVARVVDRIERFPDVELVAILGDVTLGTQTVAKLQGSVDWPNEAEELAYRTGLSETVLRRAAEKLGDRVKAFASNEDLVEGISGVLLPGSTLHSLGEGPFAQIEEDRFLRLQLEDREFGLPPENGCRVATGAQAFPVVLERLRQIGERAAVPDAAGVPMIDLIDFRIQVVDPGRDQIPGFYRNDKDVLESYYQKAFLDEEEGKFARELKDQLPRVVAHVAHAITRKPKPFSTRRAILVVPHLLSEIENGVEVFDLSPLGLVSIRVIPRFDGEQRAFLHTSFTWRTVEALVGLPYSLYGSLRYSQYLAERIQQEVANVQGSPPVHLADVSYIAHSLHVTTDDYGLNVARRIIHLSGE